MNRIQTHALLAVCGLLGFDDLRAIADSPNITSAITFEQPERTAVDVAKGANGMVVSETPLASLVGRGILSKGGSAVDAAVAVAIALQVTRPEAGNIGGGGFMMLAPPSPADGEPEVLCVDYRETAPQSNDAGPLNPGSLSPYVNTWDVKFAGVPGTLRGLELAHQRYGRLPWSELFEPSIQLCENGFPVDAHFVYSVNTCLQSERIQSDHRYEELRRVYSGPNDGYWRVGDRFRQPDLAKTLRLIGDQGADAFYEGPIADQIVQEMHDFGGWITKRDLAQYKAVTREALHTRIGGMDVYGAPPPSSGGTVVLMQLKMLERLGFVKPFVIETPNRDWTADQVHLATEVMRRAFRDRAEFLGDPAFTDLPDYLLSDKYVDDLVQTIDREHATSSVAIAGNIPLRSGPPVSEETTHFSIVDSEGFAVSNTYTLEHRFGCRIVVRGMGFLLNNEMGDFNRVPGYTNMDGWIGTPPNQVAPNKRMLSSMSPTIVKKHGHVRLVVGSPGSRSIINSVTLVIAQHLFFGRTLEQSVDAQRFHHQWLPDQIRMEKHFVETAPELVSELSDRGHQVIVAPTHRQGSVHAISIIGDTQEAIGVADWRRGGAAEAVAQRLPATERQDNNRPRKSMDNGGVSLPDSPKVLSKLIRE
ncbi:gamma-glutamyltransferase [Neorhodopirellula lusitana]|uniref:gamma-glutamyltransferase n=1 Tax=Neorhodopirellula lusitana TaxID=445327 RepID=UPI00384FBB73